MAANFPGQDLVIRSDNSNEIAKCLVTEDLRRIRYIQVLDIREDPKPIMNAGFGIPVDLLVRVPDEYGLLYDWASLLPNHPMRVSVPVVEGARKVIKLAASLSFAVKLEVLQPNSTQAEEMLKILEFYLHSTTLAEPIEYFHSILFSFFRHEPKTLWEIQEEDPSIYCRIDENGRKTPSRRLPWNTPVNRANSFVHDFKKELIAENNDCSRCEFIDHCVGFFKLPIHQYNCKTMKRLFQILRDTAEELRRDIDSSSLGNGTGK